MARHMYVSNSDSHIVSQPPVSCHEAFTVRKYTLLCGFTHFRSLVSTQTQLFPDLWVCCTSSYQDPAGSLHFPDVDEVAVCCP